MPSPNPAIARKAAHSTTGVVVPIMMSKPVPAEQTTVPASMIGNCVGVLLAQLDGYTSREKYVVPSFCGKTTSHNRRYDLRHCERKEFNATTECRRTANGLKIERKVVQLLKETLAADTLVQFSLGVDDVRCCLIKK